MQRALTILSALILLVSGRVHALPEARTGDARPLAKPGDLATAPIQIKTLPLDEFMPRKLSVPIDVPVVVPIDYELASLPQAPLFSAYWMKPQDVEAANRTQDLPAGNGYMLGAISSGVGYDRKRDVFAGVDDPDTLEKFKSDRDQFSSVTIERFTYGNFPVLLMTGVHAGSGKLAYFMYVGLNQDVNVALVALRPPANSRLIGDYVWGELKRKLVKSATIPVRMFP